MVVLLRCVFERSGVPKKTRQKLKSFAGVCVADRSREEAEAEDNHENVQHGMLLVARFVAQLLRGYGNSQLRRINPWIGTIPALPVSVVVKCHPQHRFSRWG